MAKSPDGRRLEGKGRAQQQRHSVLPESITARDPDEVIQVCLRNRLAELERLLGVEALRNARLTRPQLEKIAMLLDTALAAVSGVSARDRTLVWLDDAMEEVGKDFRGDLFGGEGSRAGPTFRMMLRFFCGLCEQFPRLQGSVAVELRDGTKQRVTEVRYMGTAMGAVAMAQRGRRSKQSLPRKWTALRNYAVAEKLVGPMEPAHFRRVVLGARQRLAKLKPPVA